MYSPLNSYTYIHWTLNIYILLVCLLLCKKDGPSPVFAIAERRDIGLYEVPLSMLGFGMGAMLTNFHMCDIMLLLRAVLNMLISLLLVPFMKQKLITLCIIEPFTVYNIFTIKILFM